MFGNLDLWFAEQFLEVTNAEWRLCEETQNPQPGAIAKTLVDLDQVHLDQHLYAYTGI